MVLTLWIVFTLSFFLMRLVPGSPLNSEKEMSPSTREKMEEYYGLNKPLWQQYISAFSKAVVFDFGPSYKLTDYTVGEIISQGFPVSASLGIFALTFALSLGTTAGVISAVRRKGIFDYSFMALATLGIAVPNFVLASIAILLFVFGVVIFPAAGWGTLSHLILPALCLGAPFSAYIARLTRAGMMEVLSLDYIRTAYAKGLSERTVILKHALRGAIRPVVTYLGPATAGILTGSLVLEQIFNIPGMGSHFIEGALQRDYTLAIGMVMIYTTLLFVMNTIVDLSYGIIDPRVKLGK